jgi:hypothetical protein
MSEIKKWYESRSKIDKFIVWLFAAVIAVFTLLFILTSTVEGSREAAEKNTLEEADVSTTELLSGALTDVLGQETNTGEPRRVEVSIFEGDLYVSYALDESFTAGSTIVGAWGDTSKIVELVQRSALSDNLTISGTLELIDTNGNSVGQTIVFTANFLDDKVPLLNTENLFGREMWESAASSFVYHPAIRD